MDGLAQLRTPLSQCVGDRTAVAGQPPLNHPSGFEVAKPVGQQIRRDAGQAFTELAVPRRSHQKLADNQQIPPVAHHIEGPGKSAVLTVVSTHHHPLAILKFA